MMENAYLLQLKFNHLKAVKQDKVQSNYFSCKPSLSAMRTKSKRAKASGAKMSQSLNRLVPNRLGAKTSAPKYFGANAG